MARICTVCMYNELADKEANKIKWIISCPSLGFDTFHPCPRLIMRGGSGGGVDMGKDVTNLR
jgi:hypothetical protein